MVQDKSQESLMYRIIRMQNSKKPNNIILCANKQAYEHWQIYKEPTQQSHTQTHTLYKVLVSTISQPELTKCSRHQSSRWLG